MRYIVDMRCNMSLLILNYRTDVKIQIMSICVVLGEIKNPSFPSKSFKVEFSPYASCLGEDCRLWVCLYFSKFQVNRFNV